MAVAGPIGLVLAYQAILQLIRLGSLGPLIDPVVYLAAIAWGFIKLKSAFRVSSVLLAIVYVPLMLAAALGASFVLAIYGGWFEP